MLRRLPPETKLIVNIRDVRDAMASYMRFMRCGFERGIEAVEGMMTLTDYYTAFTDADRLVVRHEDLVGRPRATVETIAGFLNLRLRDEVLDIVEREWSRENVLARIAATEKDLKQRARDRAPILPIEVAPNADGTVRAYDTRTGFQSGHISADGGKGWRARLMPPQQERLLALTRSWLE